MPYPPLLVWRLADGRLMVGQATGESVGRETYLRCADGRTRCVDRRKLCLARQPDIDRVFRQLFAAA